MYKKIINFLKYSTNYMLFFVESRLIKQPKIKNTIETLEYIYTTHCSVSRFGDGEFKWIAGIKQNSFQDDAEDMSNRLKEIIVSNLDNHIVCIPDRFYTLSECRKDSKIYWAEFMRHYRKKWINLLDIKKVYYDTNISRLYYAHNDIKITEKSVCLWKKIWNHQNIVIVEGEFTKLGVGNDLFSNANSVKRIICPAKNAWNKYDEILIKTKEIASNDNLILIALGPTATVMAFDLSKAGYWAIDIGHIDIEYEWFLLGANEKVPIKGKYTNESNNDLLETSVDLLYDNQIVAKIGVK